MQVVRPVQLTDLDALLELAHLTGFGLTTLPRDTELLRERIEESLIGFRRMPQRPRGESYLFVLQDTQTGKVVGTSGIASKVGGFEPFYSYRLETVVHASEMLKVRKEIQTLNLVTEHNGPCEIGSLFLHPDFRKDGNGRLLSLSRFLFMAEHGNRFDPVVIAEMRGVIDDQGRSPFWDALGKHFFEIDFPKADYLSMVNKKFIADLMPRHPIYVPLLPDEAKQVIGQVHPQTRPALELLKSEGFEWSGMVDIFEAGPVMVARIGQIRTVHESRRALLREVVKGPLESDWMHVLNPRIDSRCARIRLHEAHPGSVVLDQEAADALELKVGDPVRYATIYPEGQMKK